MGGASARRELADRRGSVNQNTSPHFLGEKGGILIELTLNHQTRSNRNEWSWTPLNKARAADILFKMNELKEFWPLGVRSIFYRLLSSDLIKQEHWHWKGKQVDIYKALSRTLKWMRLSDMVPWNAITDSHRTITAKGGYADPEEFIRAHLYWFLRNYTRCMAQKQENYIEVWIEKEGLLHIVQPIAKEFCLRVTACRGYNSITFQTQFYNRATEAINAGQTPIVLYFGDWDPSGVDMIYAAMQTLTDELDLYGVEYYQAGINPEHFHMISADPVPLKPGDSRTKKFIKKYGETVYELDAFHPKQLQNLVRESIEQFTDMSMYEENVNQEYDDQEEIDELRDDVLEYMEERLG